MAQASARAAPGARCLPLFARASDRLRRIPQPVLFLRRSDGRAPLRRGGSSSSSTSRASSRARWTGGGGRSRRASIRTSGSCGPATRSRPTTSCGGSRACATSRSRSRRSPRGSTRSSRGRIVVTVNARETAWGRTPGIAGRDRVLGAARRGAASAPTTGRRCPTSSSSRRSSAPSTTRRCRTARSSRSTRSRRSSSTRS